MLWVTPGRVWVTAGFPNVQGISNWLQVGAPNVRERGQGGIRVPPRGSQAGREGSSPSPTTAQGILRGLLAFGFELFELLLPVHSRDVLSRHRRHFS